MTRNHRSAVIPATRTRRGRVVRKAVLSRPVPKRWSIVKLYRGGPRR